MKTKTIIAISLLCMLCGCGSEPEVQAPVKEPISETSEIASDISSTDNSAGAEATDSAADTQSDETADTAADISSDEPTSGESANPSSDTTSDLPIEDEIYDCVLGATILDTGRDLIGTTNDVGVLYSVVYKGEFTDDGFTLYGSMDIKNFREQDPISVSDEQAHVFHTDGSTVYQMIGGEDGPEDVSREDFIANFNNCVKVGMYMEVEVKNGIATLVTISA